MIQTMTLTIDEILEAIVDWLENVHEMEVPDSVRMHIKVTTTRDGAIATAAKVEWKR